MSDDEREEFLKARTEENRAALAARRAAVQATSQPQQPAPPTSSSERRPRPEAFDPAAAAKLLGKDDLLLFFSETIRSDAVTMKDRIAAAKLLGDAYHMFDEVPEALRSSADLRKLSAEELLDLVKKLSESLKETE